MTASDRDEVTGSGSHGVVEVALPRGGRRLELEVDHEDLSSCGRHLRNFVYKAQHYDWICTVEFADTDRELPQSMTFCVWHLGGQHTWSDRMAAFLSKNLGYPVRVDLRPYNHGMDEHGGFWSGTAEVVRLAPDANCIKTVDGGCASTRPCLHWLL